MSKRITLICIILMYQSSTDAFLTDLLSNAMNYVNNLNSSPSTALRGLGDKLLDGKHVKSGHDMDFQMHEIQDDFTLQKAILQVRLKAAKRFIQSRSDFLKFTDHWEVNKAIVFSKRFDLEVAKNDVEIIEEALENPSRFKNMFLKQD